jgi:CHAT domain-containing protein
MTVAAQQARDATLPPLVHVVQEVEQVTELAISAGADAHVIAPFTPVGEVIRSLQAASIVHLACHGIQDHARPHESHFSIDSGNITVSALMKMELPYAFLAFLSACETATGDRKHADEVIHLASTMLFAGFTSVVATMWYVILSRTRRMLMMSRAMRDEDGPIVAKRFYERLFEAEAVDADAVAYALDEAVAALRASGAPPERWATFVHMGA